MFPRSERRHLTIARFFFKIFLHFSFMSWQRQCHAFEHLGRTCNEIEMSPSKIGYFIKYTKTLLQYKTGKLFWVLKACCRCQHSSGLSWKIQARANGILSQEKREEMKTPNVRTFSIRRRWKLTRVRIEFSRTCSRWKEA